jgi:hypothetical protein
VPFHFKVLRPSRFLRNIRVVRTTPIRRLVLDTAAITGAGWIGMKLTGHGKRVGPQAHEIVRVFGSWADSIWEAAQGSYALIAGRDAATVEALYPASESRFLRIRAGGGWAVLLDTRMRQHKQFGDMRVGSIIDCLATPGQAAQVMRAAAGVLEERGVDLIVSNQLHRVWTSALLDSGFRKGPSNFLLALSPAMAALTGDAADHDFHFNRGDGDGPIHL